MEPDPQGAVRAQPQNHTRTPEQTEPHPEDQEVLSTLQDTEAMWQRMVNTACIVRGSFKATGSLWAFQTQNYFWREITALLRRQKKSYTLLSHLGHRQKAEVN